VLITVVIPVFNEENTLPALLERLTAALVLLGEFEILFVDDGSTDQSGAILAQAAQRDRRIKFLQFSRNFGHQIALTAGLDFASGDAIIVMDADLQDPPELLSEMLRLYHEGYDVVSPQRISREGESYFKQKTASLFYWLMRNAVDHRLPREVGDFRLFSRRALVALGSLREQHRFMRGMVAWMGLPEAFVPYQRAGRHSGVTKYPIGKMLRLAWTAITSFSGFPLQLCFYLGIVTNMLGIGMLVYVIVRYFQHQTVQGWASLAVIQVIFSGVVLLAVGVLGEYVARIYEESKARPLYVVKQAGNLHPTTIAARAVILPPR
jgi:dolichol-phosphate mannosyltransferase